MDKKVKRVGWVKLWRKLQYNEMYEILDSKQRDVMMQILMLADFKPSKWEWLGQVYETKEGQFITSLDSLKKNCAKDVSKQNIRTTLKKLEKWGFLTNESTKTGRLITIVKWDTYQSQEEPTNTVSNKELTDSQQRANKELTPNEEDKEIKDYKETKEVDSCYRAGKLMTREDAELYDLTRD